MERNAYLLVSDLHYSDVQKTNRINYQDEVNYVLQYIFKCVKKYKDIGYDVNVIFLGDIFDTSFKSITKAIRANNIISTLAQACKVYSVLGNHEITYSKNNPFYSLVRNVDSGYIKSYSKKELEFTGVRNSINIPDKLVDGEVVFYFNHYGMDVMEPKIGVTRIGLFHHDIVHSSIRKYASSMLGEEMYGVTIDDTRCDALGMYTHCYFGHIHKIYGKFEIEDSKTLLHYLASLGRPNVSEVRDDFLERCIPAVLVHNGELHKIEDNYITLMKYSECVNELAEIKRREKYSIVKDRKDMRGYDALSDIPVNNLIGRCVYEQDRAVIEELLKNNILFGNTLKDAKRVAIKYRNM